MTTIDAQDFEQNSAALLIRAAAGEHLLILRDNQPIAELHPAAASVPRSMWRRPIGLAAGEFVVPDDFDDPLPEDILQDFEGQ